MEADDCESQRPDRPFRIWALNFATDGQACEVQEICECSQAIKVFLFAIISCSHGTLSTRVAQKQARCLQSGPSGSTQTQTPRTSVTCKSLMWTLVMVSQGCNYLCNSITSIRSKQAWQSM